VVAAACSALRASLDAALTAAGFQVTARCDNAQAAVEAVARDRPDVCIVESHLPGGALVAAAAIALPQPPPAVLMIGPEDTTVARRAAELAGASRYLPGDLDEDRLTDTVKALADQRKQQP
jgi:two-component system, NarL family, nitrate/nitrite response regulator NarL